MIQHEDKTTKAKAEEKSHLIKRPVKTCKDGATYHGEWNRSTNLKEGKGTMIYEDGVIIEGYWLKDMLHGRARQIDRQGNIYIGQFRKNMRHGKGLLVYDCGDFYSGDFDRNEFYGRGISMFFGIK